MLAEVPLQLHTMRPSSLHHNIIPTSLPTQRQGPQGRSLPRLVLMLQGILQLHNHSPIILHRDLKSPNLLVDKHWRVKVGDFNLSRVMEGSAVLSSITANNPRWLAPEVRLALPAELSSLPVVFCVICCGGEHSFSLWLSAYSVPCAVSQHWRCIVTCRGQANLLVAS